MHIHGFAVRQGGSREDMVNACTRTSHCGVVVDDREVRLLDALRIDHPSLAALPKRLVTGDVHIMQGDEVVLALERKTREDLRASLLDGRFHSQRSRLVSEFGQGHVAFVVEGSTCWSDPESGAEIALTMRDGLVVFWSKDVFDTAALVARLSNTDLQARSCPPSGQNMIRTAKADALDAARSLSAMVRCVPGVSAKRAETLSSHFGSMSALVSSFSENDAETVRSISNLRSVGAKGRLGSNLATRIALCLGLKTPSMPARRPGKSDSASCGRCSRAPGSPDNFAESSDLVHGQDDEQSEQNKDEDVV